MREESRFKIGRGLFFAGLCLSLTGVGFAEESGRARGDRNADTLVQPPQWAEVAESPASTPAAPEFVTSGFAAPRSSPEQPLSPLARSDSLLAQAARDARDDRLLLGVGLIVGGPALYLYGSTLYLAEMMNTLFEEGREPSPTGPLLMSVGVGATVFGIVTLIRKWEPEREWRDAQKSGRLSLNLHPSGRGAALALRF